MQGKIKADKIWRKFHKSSEEQQTDANKAAKAQAKAAKRQARLGKRDWASGTGQANHQNAAWSPEDAVAPLQSGMERLSGMVGRTESRSAVVSVSVHLAVLAALLGSWRMGTRVVAPKRLPGTAAGTRLMLEYSPGGAPPTAATALHEPRPVPLPAPATQAKMKATPVPSAASPAAPGTGTSGESSLGDGDISIALVRVHPRPAPDLSGLPHGTAGDVVVDVVIDERGNIATAKLERGLGGAIDQTVLAIVQGQWTFAPATRNGVAIASEQELLFHYERS